MRFAVQLLVFAIAALQAGQQSTSRSLKVNRDSFDLAANTGGDFYFWAPGEFGAMALRVPVHHENVLLSYGSVHGKTPFEFPVESSVQEMTLFAGIERKDLAVLVRPDRTVAHDGDPGVDLQTFQRMLIATVKSPQPGTWRLEIDGDGLYAVTVHVKQAEDGPELIRFSFIEPGGRPGHEGMFPVTRAVRAGETLDCEVALSGSLREAELVFVTGDGAPLSTMPLKPAGVDQYTGRCSVPKGPFRAMVRGKDTKDLAFQRVESPLRKPE